MSRNSLSLLLRHRRETLGLEKVDACLLLAEIRFETNKNERGRWAEMEDLGIPLSCQVSLKASHQQLERLYLVHNIFQGVGAVDRKADEEQISLWI